MWKSIDFGQADEAVQSSLYLPRNQDPSLREIDDLLPNHNQLNDDSLRSLSGVNLERLVSVLKDLYLDTENSKILTDPICIVPIIQLAEISPFFCIVAIEQVMTLINSWNLENACLILKALRVLTSKATNHEWAACFILHELIAWLIKIMNLPEPHCPEKRRYASWMRRQAKDILEFKHKHFEDCRKQDENFSAWMLDPSQVVNLLTFGPSSFRVNVRLDQLYSYFTSTKDENQRIKLIEYFLTGCLELNDKYGPPRTIEMPSNTLFLGYMYHLTQSFCAYFETLYKQYHEDNWKKIEKYLQGYRREPYLSANSGDLTEICIWEDQQNDDCPKDDFTIEKSIFFDVFLNRLELMNILQTVFWKTADILQLEPFPEGYESMVFWMGCFMNSPRDVVTEALKAPGSVKIEAWKWHEFALKMCPFLYLSRGLEHYADSLSMFLRGELIDPETLSELYFAVNDVPKKTCVDYNYRFFDSRINYYYQIIYLCE